MDTQLFFLINSHHDAFFDQFFWLVSGKAVWIPLYIALLYAVWRNYSWRGVLTILCMVGIGMLFTDCLNSQLLRPWIGRLRPSNPDNPIAPLVHIVNGHAGHGCGFPSAHSANIWLLTYLVLHWFREKWTALMMVTIALLVCYSRIYLGMHYPGDILGGFVLARLVVAFLFKAEEYVASKTQNDHLSTDPADELRHTWVPVLTASLTLVTFAVIAAIKC